MRLNKRLFSQAARLLWATLALSVSADVVASKRDNITCGIVPGQPLTNAYGPYDFTNPAHQPNLGIVLGAHFTPSVERLISGNRGKIIADIDYTLRAIPNYHRALNSMARYQREKKLRFEARDKYFTADCYFKRALYMQPKDAVSHMLFAIHLQFTERLEEAQKHYEAALKLQPNNPELHYNAGLLYVELGELEKAQKHADFAYSRKFPLPGLAQRIAALQKDKSSQ